MQEIIVLACSECKRKNYSTRKNKKQNPDRLERRKFCSACRKHVAHKEQK